MNSEEEAAAVRQHLAGEGVNYDNLPEYGDHSSQDVSLEATQRMIDSVVDSTKK